VIVEALKRGSSPEQFSAFLRSEIPKYSKILKESGAKLD
jgi:hypothetical protein